MGISEGKKVILYAPTWREISIFRERGIAINYRRILISGEGRWGKSTCLFGAHYFISSQFDFAAYGDFVIDVSQVDDVNELYLAADF